MSCGYQGVFIGFEMITSVLVLSIKQILWPVILCFLDNIIRFIIWHRLYQRKVWRIALFLELAEGSETYILFLLQKKDEAFT